MATRVRDRLRGDDRGADLVEYALLAAFFGLAVVAGFGNLQTTIDAAYQLWDGSVQGISMPADPVGGGS